MGQGSDVAEAEQAFRALRHQLAEYDLRTFVVRSGDPLGEALA
jgi:DNA primase